MLKANCIKKKIQIPSTGDYVKFTAGVKSSMLSVIDKFRQSPSLAKYRELQDTGQDQYNRYTVRYLTDTQSINRLLMSSQCTEITLCKGKEKGDFFLHTQLDTES